MILTMLICKIIRTQQFKYFLPASMKTKVNLVKTAGHRHVALTKSIGSKSVVWECFGIPFYEGENGLRSTNQTKICCFVLNFIHVNVKWSFTSIYWKVKYHDTYRIVCHVSWYVSDRLGTVLPHPYWWPVCAEVWLMISCFVLVVSRVHKEFKS